MLDLGCDNDTPPIPASPRGPGSLVIQVTDPPDEDADPFTDKDVTLESVYGTTPSWWTYKNGCTGQFIANAGTALGNITLALTGIIPNWTHALLHSVVSPDSWLQALTDPVVEATQAVTDAVWAPWLTVVLLIVGARVLWRARSGAFAGSVQAAAWALGVLFVVSVAIQYPAESVRLVDSGVRTLTITVITAFNSDAPHPRPGEDPAAVAVAGQMDDIVRSTQYETWLSGALGDAHCRTAEKYGPDLFKATHLTWAEAKTYQDDPTREGKDLISEKQDAFTTITEEIERNDPVAYDHLRGEHWAKRITVSLVNAAAVVVVCGYLLIAGLVILLAYALIRLVVPLMPAAGVLFMIEPTRDLAIGWLKRIVGPLVMGPVYFLVALILLRFDTSVLATAIPWPLKVAIIGVLAYLAWTLTKPATYGLGAIGHGAGVAWAFAAGHSRRARHGPPSPPGTSGAVVSPSSATPVASQRVVFMPGITDRPAIPTADAHAERSAASAAATEDEAIAREVPERSTIRAVATGQADTTGDRPSRTQPARFGYAESFNYRETFRAANPEIADSVVVHHAVEQQAMRKYDAAGITLNQMHSLENLRGIPKTVNGPLHLSAIRKEWNRFYREHPSATQDELLAFATRLDEKYGSHFNPRLE